MKKRRDQIVFLDAATVDWGDLSLSELKSLGHLKTYPQTSYRDIEKRIKSADIVITNKCRFDRALMNKLKRVRSIHVAATGMNNVDLEAAREIGIAVTNVSGYSTESVVQFTFASLLALAGNLLPHYEAAHHGGWSRSPSFTFTDFPFHEVAGKTLGIVGYGSIGKRVAQVAKIFKIKVLVARIPGRRYPPREFKNRTPFLSVIRKADFLTLHVPLTRLTRRLITAEVIRKMKPGAFLLNMARGGIVDEKALRKALERGHLAGAACDVLSVEPPPKDHVFLKAPNLLMTPHVAWASCEARRRLLDEIALNIRAFQKGRKRNRVD